MDASKSSPKQQILQCVVALAIFDAGRPLSWLQDATGLHRSKLGRMRSGRHAVNFKDAEIVFRALDKPVRGLLRLTRLGDDGMVSSEDLACLAGFSRKLAIFSRLHSDAGPTLDPKLVDACLQYLAGLFADHDTDIEEADPWRSQCPRRVWSG